MFKKTNPFHNNSKMVLFVDSLTSPLLILTEIVSHIDEEPTPIVGL